MSDVLPLLISVPHAGLRVPEEARDVCLLSPREVAEDGDVGAAAIYDIRAETAEFVDTDVARAIVDLNRVESDRRKDGVVKTHTCWDVPVYRSPLSEAAIESLLARYYRPYHRRLTDLAGRGLLLGVDCHTMAAQGPPVGPDPGEKRPWVCLSNADGTCPERWIRELARCFEECFGGHVSINRPFRGGHITRSHAAEMPWLQLEISRAPFASDDEKRARVLQALRAWCDSTAGTART